MQTDIEPLEITYSESIENTEANIIKTTAEFMSILDQEGQIEIEGAEADQFIFSAGSKNYKLRGIYLPTTLLVTPDLGTSKPQTDNSTSTPSLKPCAKILLQTTKYLKIQPHEVEFHLINQDLAELALQSNLITDKVNFECVLQNEGVSLSNLRAKYQLTPALIEKLASAGPFAFYPLPDLQDTLLLQLSLPFMSAVMKQIIPVLTSQGSLGKWFSYAQIKDCIQLLDLKLFDTTARYFSFQSTPTLTAPSISCNEMQIERQYKITLPSLLKFFMIQILAHKPECTHHEIEEIIKNLQAIYLPIGEPQFSQEKARELRSEIIAQYYLAVPKKEHVVYVYYDPLTINVNVKARVQHMSTYKKKFSRDEIYGMFLPWYSPQEVNQILMKNFRKMGKDFEIKLIIPK